MVSFLLSFLVAQVTEYSGLNLTSILLNEFNKIKNRPDFDPATIKSDLRYRYDDQPKRLNVSVEVFSPMEIIGLRQLQLKEVDVDLKPMPMQIDLSLKYHLDKLKGVGTYKLKGKAMQVIPIKGHGPFYIQMEDIRGFVNMTIAHNGTQFMVDSLKFDLHFNKLKHYFSNLIFKGLSRVTNTIMNGFSKQLVYKVLIKNESVMNDVKRKLSSIIDRRLHKLHSNIMDYIGSYVGLKGSSSSDSD